MYYVNMLNEYFAQCFNSVVPPLLLNEVGLSLSSYPEECLCTEDGSFSLMQILDTSKANGPDEISVKMLISRTLWGLVYNN